MQPLPRPSVSPLYSFCSMPTHRAVSFSESLKAIIAWLRGTKSSRSEEQLQARLVDRLAEELAENEPPAETSRIDKPKLQPKRPRRLTGREDR
jgi:hypothetical protein